MSKMIAIQEPANHLLEEGFFIFENVLSKSMIYRLREATNSLLDDLSDEQRATSGHQGSVIQMEFQFSVFQELIAWPDTLKSLSKLGFDHPRYWSAYIISKEPKTPQNYWHQDWPFWGNAASYATLPHQLFIMFYLVDTNRENGCLRVIPRSHQNSHPAHNYGHDGDIRFQDPEKSPAYKDYPEQKDLPVKTGDLVIGDARLLHSTNPNRTDRRRTVITMWYLPRYEDLTEAMKSAFQSNLMVIPPSELSSEQIDLIYPLLPDYSGHAISEKWNRIPLRFLNDSINDKVDEY